MSRLEDFERALKERKATYQELEDLGFPRSTAEKYMRELRDQGLAVYEERLDRRGTKAFYVASGLWTPDTHIVTPQEHYRLGITSDWHIGAKSCYEDAIKAFLDDCDKAQVHRILFAGDMFEGWQIYKGQIHELKPEAIGVDNQVEYVNRTLPDLPAPMSLIGGNHDIRNDTNMLRLLVRERTQGDMEYLGDYNEILDLNGVKVELMHPSGGKPYSRGYRIQTTTREREDGSLPDMYLMGHLHSALFMPDKGMAAFETGAFLGPNSLTRRHGWDTTAHAWIVDLYISDEEIQELIPHYLVYAKN
jgi:hypothetical protein